MRKTQGIYSSNKACQGPWLVAISSLYISSAIWSQELKNGKTQQFLKHSCPNCPFALCFFYKAAWYNGGVTGSLKSWQCQDLLDIGISVEFDKCRIRGERIVFWWPNTNTNIIRFEKINRIQMQILFGLKKSTEYEYKYYLVWKNQPNMNTNIIRSPLLSNMRRIFQHADDAHRQMYPHDQP